MFERFSDEARAVVVLAQEEATGFGHAWIGTEHLLCALVREGHGVAADVLAQLGLSLERVRGLGERAFVVRGDEGWVNVLKGDVYLSVQLDHPSLSAQERQSRAMSLARTALGRL